MSDTAIIIHLLPLLVLVQLFMRLRRSFRVAVLEAAVVWAGSTLVLTEVLSAFRALTFSTLVGGYALLSVAGIVVLVRLRSATRFPTLPSRFTLLEVALVVAIIVYLGLTLVIAVAAPPNNADSQTYRLPRVEHWIQNGSLHVYPTHVDRQVALPPLAEILILQGRLLTGRDTFAALIQWLASLGSLVGVSLIARHFGAARLGQLLAAVLCSTIPMGIVQSNSTQNDYVVAFFLVVGAERLIDVMRHGQRGATLSMALAIGLAASTKGTAYVIGLPFGLWFLVWAVRAMRWRAASTLSLCALVAIAPNVPTFIRNWTGSGMVLGNVGGLTNNASFGPAQTADNLVRNLVMHFAAQDERWNQWLITAANAFAGTVGALRYRDETTLRGTQFALPSFEGWRRWEDVAGNPLHTVLIFATFVLVLVIPRFRRNPLVLQYMGVLVLGALSYSVVLRWQPWGNRLQLPLYVLGTPLVAQVMAGLFRHGCVAVAVVAVVMGWPFLTENERRPLWPVPIWRHPRHQALFATLPDLAKPYHEVMAFIREAGFRNIGLVLGPDDWEYPIWVLLRPPEIARRMRIEHFFVSNDTAKFGYPLGPFKPEALIWIETAPVDRSVLADEQWVKAFDAAPLAVYVRPP